MVATVTIQGQTDANNDDDDDSILRTPMPSLAY